MRSWRVQPKTSKALPNNEPSILLWSSAGMGNHIRRLLIHEFIPVGLARKHLCDFRWQQNRHFSSANIHARKVGMPDSIIILYEMILLADIFKMEWLSITSCEILNNRNLPPILLAHELDIPGSPSLSNSNDGLDLYSWRAIRPSDMTSANPKTFQKTSQPSMDI